MLCPMGNDWEIESGEIEGLLFCQSDFLISRLLSRGCCTETFQVRVRDVCTLLLAGLALVECISWRQLL